MRSLIRSGLALIGVGHVSSAVAYTGSIGHGIVVGVSDYLGVDAANFHKCLQPTYDDDDNDSSEAINLNSVSMNFGSSTNQLEEFYNYLHSLLDVAEKEIIPHVLKCKYIEISNNKREEIQLFADSIRFSKDSTLMGIFLNGIKQSAYILDLATDIVKADLENNDIEREGSESSEFIIGNKLAQIAIKFLQNNSLDTYEIVTGVTDSLEKSIPDIAKCVKDILTVLPELQSILYRLSNGSPIDKVKALKEFKKLYKVKIQPIMNECVTQKVSLEEKTLLGYIMDYIENSPGIFIAYFGTNYLKTQHSVDGSIYISRNATIENKSKVVGEQLGLILNDVYLSRPEPSDDDDEYVQLNQMLDHDINYIVSEPVSPKDARLFGVGFIQGFVGDYPNLKSCVLQMGGMSHSLRDAIETISKRTFSDVLEGLRLLSETLQNEFVQTLSSCKGAQEETLQLIEALEAMSNPVSFSFEVARRLMINGADIYGDFEDAISAYKSHDYSSFGNSIGVAANKILVGTAKLHIEEIPQKELEHKEVEKESDLRRYLKNGLYVLGGVCFSSLFFALYFRVMKKRNSKILDTNGIQSNQQSALLV